MSKVCEVCGKHPVAGRSISHSHRVSNRMGFRPNIQKITIRDAKGHVRRANVCTSCMKAGKGGARLARALPLSFPENPKARPAGFLCFGTKLTPMKEAGRPARRLSSDWNSPVVCSTKRAVA